MSNPKFHSPVPGAEPLDTASISAWLAPFIISINKEGGQMDFYRTPPTPDIDNWLLLPLRYPNLHLVPSSYQYPKLINLI